MAGGKFKVLSLFSGLGALDLGLERSGGFEPVAMCEINPQARAVLAAHWPGVPIYDDVRTVSRSRLLADGVAPDFLAAGFPCQDISVANVLGRGLEGSRSGLFYEVVRLARELELRGLLLENVANLLGRGLGDVLGALAALGFDAEWHCIPAAHIGAPHRRDRIWIVAYPQREGREGLEPLHGFLGREIETLSVAGNPFADAWMLLDGGFEDIRGRDGATVAMERRRLGLCGNAVVPQIPELIGRAILAAEGRVSNKLPGRSAPLSRALHCADRSSPNPLAPVGTSLFPPEHCGGL